MLGKICDIGKYLAAYATPALALLPLVQAHVLHVAHVVSKGLGTEVAAEGHDSGFFIAVRLFVAVFPFCVPPQSRKRGNSSSAGLTLETRELFTGFVFFFLGLVFASILGSLTTNFLVKPPEFSQMDRATAT